MVTEHDNLGIFCGITDFCSMSSYSGFLQGANTGLNLVGLRTVRRSSGETIIKLYYYYNYINLQDLEFSNLTPLRFVKTMYSFPMSIQILFSCRSIETPSLGAQKLSFSPFAFAHLSVCASHTASVLQSV